MINTQTILDRAAAAAKTGQIALREALDEIPAAIYVTDEAGLVTYFNPACLDFTGRRPQVGSDRWCVTWRLYTDTGEHLPHDQCPMAVAIKDRKAIRGVTAIAERPDGTRVVFRPYPTPIFDNHGRFVGAVNILEDVTDTVRADEFRAQAARCRRLANGVYDVQAAETLNRMAAEYDAKAAALTGLTPS